MAADAVRSERIELRVTPDEKRLLGAAASTERLGVSAFVLRAALPAAREVLLRERRIELSDRDTELVLALLDAPPEPTPVLLAAAKRTKYRP